MFQSNQNLSHHVVTSRLNNIVSALPSPLHKQHVVDFALGKHSKRIISYTSLAEITCYFAGIPPWLFEQCRLHTATVSETSALCVPLADGRSEVPSLPRVLTILDELYEGSTKTRHELITSTWMLLTTPQRILFNRMLVGGFRHPIVKGLCVSDNYTFSVETPPFINDEPIQVTAVLLSVKRDADGFQFHFGIKRNETLVPIVSLPAETISESDRRILLQHADAHTTEKFGPVRVVLPTVFAELRLHDVSIAPRKKSGVEVGKTEVLHVENTTSFLANTGIEIASQSALDKVSDISASR